MKINVLAACFSALFVAGCGGQPQDSAATAESDAAASGAHHAQQGGGIATGAAVDAPISPADLDLVFRIIDGPRYDKAADRVSFTVEAQNRGTKVLSSAGSFPVNIGLNILGPDGTVDTPPGNRDFHRIPLTEPLAPGAKTEFRAEFSAAPTIGGSVVLDGVQEGVSWFSGYGKQTLDLGSFTRCSSEEASLCDEAGAPIPPAQ